MNAQAKFTLDELIGYVEHMNIYANSGITETVLKELNILKKQLGGNNMNWTYETNGNWNQEEFATREEAILHGSENNEGTFLIGQIKEEDYLYQVVVNTEEVGV